MPLLDTSGGSVGAALELVLHSGYRTLGFLRFQVCSDSPSEVSVRRLLCEGVLWVWQVVSCVLLPHTKLQNGTRRPLQQRVLAGRVLVRFAVSATSLGQGLGGRVPQL